jgi:hypothetical protein
LSCDHSIFTHDNISYLILELVHPLVSRTRSRWIWSRGKRYLVIAKLGSVKIAWIIGEMKGQTIVKALNNRIILS